MDSPAVENLFALVTDVLAHSEARQRAARRLHQITHDMKQTLRDTGGVDALRMEKLRDQVSTIRELGGAEHLLLDEVESTLSRIGS